MRFTTGRRQVQALERISLTVPNGQFACIVGPSGCGKSTLLMVAAGLTEPSEGDVLVDGKPASEPGADRGMVFQSYSLYPWLSVRRNIEFGLEIKQIPRAQRRQRSSELIHLMKLDGFAEAYPKQTGRRLPSKYPWPAACVFAQTDDAVAFRDRSGARHAASC